MTMEWGNIGFYLMSACFIAMCCYEFGIFKLIKSTFTSTDCQYCVCFEYVYPYCTNYRATVEKDNKLKLLASRNRGCKHKITS